MATKHGLSRILAWLGLAGLVLMGVAGCYDTSLTQVSLATPGQYKGRTDPLVAKLQTGGTLEHKLQLRFKQAEERR